MTVEGLDSGPLSRRWRTGQIVLAVRLLGARTQKPNVLLPPQVPKTSPVRRDGYQSIEF